MRKLILISAATLALLVIACGGDDDGDTTATPTTAASAEPTASTGGQSPGECADLQFPITAGELAWALVLPDQLPDLGDYTIEDAEGDAPLINVLKGGDVIGTIELLQFPADGNVDVTKAVVEGLQEWAEGFYASVATDRESAGGTFESDDPEEASLGEACGVRYGYTVTDDSDEVIESYAGYVTHDGDRMFLFVAIYDAAIAEEQGFASASALQEFEPEFKTLMASLDIPPG